MNIKIAPIIEKVNSIEKQLQEIKLSLLTELPLKETKTGLYSENNILKEVKKIRKRLWNEKYLKTAKGLS